MRYTAIAGNWLLVLLLGIGSVEYFDIWWGCVQEYSELAVSGGISLFFSIVFAVKRRITTKQPMGNFFSQKRLMVPLEQNKRSRYSDRMAYVLAEMSELAYYEVERAQNNFVQFALQAKKIDPSSQAAIDRLISFYQKLTRSDSTGGTKLFTEEHLQEALDKGGFKYHPPYLNHGSAQGFICYKKAPSPYIVVAFRGSEKKIEDWLTNIDAVPVEVEGGGKVHRGFYQDFMELRETIERSIELIRKHLNDDSVPVYFTGHSLGGALATIATRELMKDGYGACYTYGAPRVGDYTYFEFVKTPVYRVVNSSDIVPRVPPGAWSTLITKLMTLARYLTVRIGWANRLIIELEGWVNRLKDYRHFGDQRYLTDVQAGKENEVKLLRNPNYFDVVQWFWRHIMVSLGMPIKSHSMTIYRKKLAIIGIKRCEEIAMQNSFAYFA